jgi:hypothetical protein
VGVVGVAVPDGATPVTYGQQLCVMLASRFSQDKAWIYIVQEHREAAMANPRHWFPGTLQHLPGGRWAQRSADSSGM